MCRIAVLDNETASLKNVQAAARAIEGEAPIEVECFATVQECRDAMHDFNAAFEKAGSSSVAPFPYDALVVSATLDGRAGAGVSFVNGLQDMWGTGLQVIYLVSGLNELPGLYETCHVAALPKPITSVQLEEALRRALAKSYSLANRPILVRSKGDLVQILPSRIGYIESDKRKIRIHDYNRGVVEAYASLSSLQELLDPLFVQCHKSFLVNMSYVRSLRKENLLMLDNSSIPVSQKRRSAVKCAFSANLAHRTVGISGADSASAR